MWKNEFDRVDHEGYQAHFWEPLTIDAPADALPYCCYLRMVVFYKRPLTTGDNGHFEEWGRVESTWDLLGTRWTDADIGFAALAPWVEFNGQLYELISAKVVYDDGRWWKRYFGRLVRSDDKRLLSDLVLWRNFPQHG